MEVVLTLSCMSCRRVLMEQKVSCSPGSHTSINIHKLLDFAGVCCITMNLVARAKIIESVTVVEPAKSQVSNES